MKRVIDPRHRTPFDRSHFLLDQHVTTPQAERTPSQSPDASTWSDRSTSVAQLRELVRTFVAERQWEKFHNPKNLAMSLAIETGELMEHFQWLTLDESLAIAGDPERKHAAGEEIADCLAYILAIANAMDLDLSEALRQKMIRNAIKYPPPGT